MNILNNVIDIGETDIDDKVIQSIRKIILTTTDIMLQKIVSLVSQQNHNRTYIKISTKNFAIYVFSVDALHDITIHSTFNENDELDIKVENCDDDYHKEDVSVVTIPKEAFKPNDIVTCVLYRTKFLFPVGNSNKQVGSIVQGVVIGNNRRIANLERPIILRFSTLYEQVLNGTGVCSFWNKGKYFIVWNSVL